MPDEETREEDLIKEEVECSNKENPNPKSEDSIVNFDELEIEDIEKEIKK